MKIVYPIMKGGLGNQLFIYAMARAHAIRTRSLLLLNVGNFQHDAKYCRAYSLNIFKMSPEIDWKSNSPYNEFLSSENQKWRRRIGFFRQEDASVGRNCLPKHWIGRLALNGYWQCEDYFSDYISQIHHDLAISDADVICASNVGRQIIAADNSVMVHVRSFHDAVGTDDDRMALPIQYYENAIKYLRAKILGELHLFLFSDEPDFAERRMRPLADRMGVRLLVVREASIEFPGADLQLMRMCRHAIVGNSTFSWWGAWLGEQDNKALGRPGVIVCPEGVPFPGANRDFYPRRWVKISRCMKGHSEYDAIIPLGTNCSVAFQLRHRGLRAESLPFDWVKMEGVAALEYLAEGIKDRFKKLCLRENLIHSDGCAEGCYLDTETHFQFLHLFGDSLELPHAYETGYQKLRSRINRFYQVIEKANSILFLSALEVPVPDLVLIKLIRSMNEAFPGKSIDFKFLQYQANRVPEPSHLDCVVNINRPISDYDMRYTTVEWAFLDEFIHDRFRPHGLQKWKYRIYRSAVKKLKNFGVGSMDDFV